jgi:hypothetical protein
MTNSALMNLRSLSQPAILDRNDSRSTSRWIIAILLAIAFEGALRKWVLPDALAGAAYFAKDMIVLAFILSHPIPKACGTLRKLRLGIAVLAILLFIPFCIGLINVPVSAITNYKNAILWPLFAMHLAARLSSKTFSRLTTPIVLILMVQLAVAFVQFRSPAKSSINDYAWQNSSIKPTISTFGAVDNVRATGTFSYITGLTSYSCFAFSFLLWRTLRPFSKNERMRAGLGVAAALACGVLSGSRAPILEGLAVLCVLALFSGSTKRKLVAVMIVVLAAALVGLIFREATAGFLARWNTSNDTTYGRIARVGLKADYWELMQQYPLGVGFGTTSGYGAYVNRDRGIAFKEISFDDGGSKAIVETGALGYVAQLLLWIGAAVTMWRGLTNRIEELRLATATLATIPVYWVCYSIWYDHNATALYWLLIALWLSTQAGVPIRKRSTMPCASLWTHRPPRASVLETRTVYAPPQISQ